MNDLVHDLVHYKLRGDKARPICTLHVGICSNEFAVYSVCNPIVSIYIYIGLVYVNSSVCNPANASPSMYGDVLAVEVYFQFFPSDK